MRAMPTDATTAAAAPPGLDHLPWARYRGANVHFGEMRCLAFAPEGTRIAFGCGTTYANAKPEQQSAVIVVVDLGSGEQVARLEGSRGTVYAVAFGPDGSRLASYDVRNSWTGDPVRTVRVWNIAQRAQIARKQCPLHAMVNWGGCGQYLPRRAVRWPCAGRLFTADGVRVGLWNDRLKPGGAIELDEPALKKPPDHVEDRVLAFDAMRDGARVVIAGARRGLMIWPGKKDAAAPEAVRGGPWMDAALDATGELVAAIEVGEAPPDHGERYPLDGMVPLKSAARPKRMALLSAADLSVRWSVPIDGNAQRVAFSSDGQEVYGADATTAHVLLHRFRAADGARMDTLKHPVEHRTDQPGKAVDERETEVRDLAVHGEMVAALTRWGIWLFRRP